MNKLIACIIILIGLFLYFRFCSVTSAVKKHTRFVDFQTLSPPSSPNKYLACPKGFCIASANQESPVFECSDRQLELLWANMIKKQPRVVILNSNTETRQNVYAQYSKIWHFPDIINVQFISLAPNRSSLAIYSHSLFGYSDFGVNQKRVQTWLSELERLERQRTI